MLYICLGIYLVIALPLTFLLCTAMIAAQWGDNDTDIETEMENDFQLITQ